MCGLFPKMLQAKSGFLPGALMEVSWKKSARRVWEEHRNDLETRATSYKLTYAACPATFRAPGRGAGGRAARAREAFGAPVMEGTGRGAGGMAAEALRFTKERRWL